MNKEQKEHILKLNKLANEFIVVSDDIHQNNISIAKLEGHNIILKKRKEQLNSKVMSLARLEVI